MATLVAAAAVSAPLDLTAAGIAIGQGFNRIYARHFLSTLVPKALAMAQRFPGAPRHRGDTPGETRCTRSTTPSPRRCTASPASDDYWRRASSKPWLGGVAVPTLVLNAKNDPFIPASSLPGAEPGQPTR